MRIPCPYCGDRSNAEFSYLGDAAPVRPRNARPAPGESDAAAAELREFTDYVYMRTNPPGLLREWWQHAGGCRAWLLVERNATTHEIGAVTAARDNAGVPRELPR